MRGGTVRWSHSRQLLALTLCCGLLAGHPVSAEEDASGDGAAVTAVEGENAPKPETPPDRRELTFTIKKIVISGSSLFPEDELQKQVRGFIGRGKTAAAVEGARDILERFFHDRGYPTVLVNIPEQKVESRAIRLEIIENRIGTLTISGNRWFSSEKIRRDLPSLAPGQVLYVPQVQREVNRLNRHPDIKVTPDVKPGKVAETVDVTLKVTDNSSWHGSVELNNRGSHDTTSLRLNTALRNDNLWQREHSLSLQYQLSPEKPSEVEIASGSYTMPAPWSFDDKLVLYGVWSNTKSAFGAGYSNLGNGIIVGTRVLLTLPPLGAYSHTAILGFDYKDFDETVKVSGSEMFSTPVSYMPLSLGYSGALLDSGGATSLNAGLTFAFRAASNEEHFSDKRYKSRGNYFTFTAGARRDQRLPLGCSLMARVDGQVADQPLISNEQFIAGGVDSVRGYKESEFSGDNALHSVLELSGPDLLAPVGKEGYSLTPYLFCDLARLWVRSPLAEQISSQTLLGSGVGMRGRLFSDLDYQLDLGFALKGTEQTDAGSALLHFKVRWQF